MSRSKRKRSVHDPIEETAFETAARLLEISGGDQVAAMSKMDEIAAVLQRTHVNGPDDVIDVMRNTLGEIEANRSLPPVSDLDRARILVIRAEDETGKERENLLRDALELSDDCAEAYIELGLDEESSEESQRLFRLALDAGARVLGARITDETGRLGDTEEGEVYLRARAVLAHAQWNDEAQLEAIEQVDEVLHLDPRDPIGITPLLAAWLIGNDDLPGIERLASRLPKRDETADLYTRAFISYLRHGPIHESEALLRTAIRKNPWVIMFMLRVPDDTETDNHWIEVSADEEELAEAFEILTSLAVEWLRSDRVSQWMVGVVAGTLVRPLRNDAPISISRARNRRKRGKS